MNERIQKLAEQAEEYAFDELNKLQGPVEMSISRRVFEQSFREKFAELIVAECADLVKARLNHIPDNQDDWDGHNYGETAAVYGILDTFQEHFGVDCDPENSKFGVEE